MAEPASSCYELSAPLSAADIAQRFAPRHLGEEAFRALRLRVPQAQLTAEELASLPAGACCGHPACAAAHVLSLQQKQLQARSVGSRGQSGTCSVPGERQGAHAGPDQERLPREPGAYRAHGGIEQQLMVWLATATLLAACTAS